MHILVLLQRTKQWGLQEKNGVLDGAKWLITLPFGIGAAIAGAAYAPTVVAGVAFTLSWILYREKSEEPTETVQEIPEAEKNDDTTSVENMDSKQDDKAVYSPLEGKLIPMTEVPDETFASKALGDGVAVIPDLQFWERRGDYENNRNAGRGDDSLPEKREAEKDGGCI